MKKHLNRVLAGAAALALLTLTGCSSQTQEPAMSIYVICKSSAEYWDTVKAGALEAGEEMGLNVVCDAPKDEVAEDQIAIINNAVANGARAIVLAPDDTDALNDTLSAAADAGVPVLTIDSDVSFEGRKSCISTQNYAAGAIAARQAASLIGEKGEIAIITHSQTAQTAVERSGGFIDEIEGNTSAMPGGKDNSVRVGRFPGDNADNPAPPENAPVEGDERPEDMQDSGEAITAGYPDISIIETADGGNEIQQSREKAVQLIKENPNLKLIYATNQPGTVGACQAIDELGVGDQVTLVGFDYFEGADTYLTSGVLDAVVAQNPYNMGYLGVRYAKKLVEGQSIAASVDTGATLITPDNMNDEDIRFLVNPTGK